ncbi:metallophosphoesterase family protein [Sporosarcina sp. Te-1]|uniref:metallophosphoesterase family protein n=1 Tax=Sporosarcina sp. Te-1 TaxID=2818390 RepID=UPI001A9DC406|nr:metallophosphoesterase family protein [Sporosarcina sp. Te-1]QTD40994.1 metallophosphoesterase family protein [Sporosarcina sp. Te-1]
MTTLHFRNDGTFKIVQFTDLHWQNGEPEDLRTAELMHNIVNTEQPDLIVFTGDVIYSPNCADPSVAYQSVARIVEEFKIPWATILGNHDAEKNCTKSELIALQQAYPHCLTVPGTKLGDRVGNYTLTVHSHAAYKPSAVLYLLDSGDNGTIPYVGGYAWVTSEQIAWYKACSQQIRMNNSGNPVFSLAFLHIPLPEFKIVWAENICYGFRFEEVCSPKINSGLFSAFVEMGDVKGVFVGHDHINDYWGELYGIRLCYGRATGYNTYGQVGFPRGARVIQLQEGSDTFSSWLILEDGKTIVEQTEHHPEAVSTEKKSK